MTRTLIIAAAAVGLASAANAQILTQWDFNDSTISPSIGSGTASLVGGTTAQFVTGGSPNDPGSPNPAWNTATYPAQGTASGTAGAQFNVSTVNYMDIEVAFDHRHSNTASRWLQFQYAIDGVNFTDFGSPIETLAGSTWYTRVFNLTGETGVNDNPDFAFRIVAIFAPATSDYEATNPGSNYGTSGTVRLDLVSVNAHLIPAPGSLAMLALGGLAAVRRRRV